MDNSLFCKNLISEMNQYPKYEVSFNDKLDVIEFVSSGRKGNIDKIIMIEPTYNPLIYNLGFGDKITKIKDNKIFYEFDDKVNSENGDRDIVLATVAASAYEYTSKYPERWLIFAGSDEVRTRLYRMAITKNYAELSQDFAIFGTVIVDYVPVPVPFDSNTRFDGFIVKRK